MVTFWLPVRIMLFPRAHSVRIPASCSIILEAIGSTFYRIVLRRNFDKTVYYKYYLQYLIFSTPVVSYWLVLLLESRTFDEQI